MSDPSSTFAGYRLEQVLSADTVSTTYRALSERRSSAHGRPVALRISHPLRTADGPDATAISDFMTAISEAVAVGGPALAGILDAGEVDERVYVATELIAGPTLDEYLRHHGPLAPATAVALLYPVAEALDRAHDAGVTHGAISPRTVLVDQQAAAPGGAPSAVLTGFGVEHLLSRQAHIDRGGVDLLDVSYVAPEQLGGQAIDGRADQYALACALYHCVAGRPPFVRDGIAALFGAHLFSDARVPAGRGDGTPLDAAVAVGMAKRPDERHPSCTTLMTSTGHGSAQRPLPAHAGAGPAAAPGVRLRSVDDVPSISEQAAGRRVRGQMRRRRLPISWPVAAMLVLAGILCTLALAAVLGGDGAGEGGATSGVGRQVSSGSIPADLDGQAEVVPAAVEWERRHGSAPILELAAVGDVVVAASERVLTAFAAEDGAQRWSTDVDVGALTDVAAADTVIGARASGLRALSPVDGAEQWSNPDVLAPLGTLTAAADMFYGIRQGRVAPELVALAADTGERMWHFDGGAEVLDESATVAVAGTHMAVLQDGHLFSIDTATASAAGGGVEARWTAEVDDPWPAGLAVAADAAVAATRDGQVCAYVTAGGDRLWCAPIVGLTDHEPAIVINGDVVVVVMRSHVALLALESGELEWVFDAEDELASTAAVQGDQVVVADVAGGLHGLDVVRRYKAWGASGFGEITALTAGEGAVSAGTGDGQVVRIRPGGPLES